MSLLTFIASDSDRLDRLLAAQPRIGSRTKARVAIESGKVDIGGVTSIELGAPVARGAEITVYWNRSGTAVDRRKGDAGLEETGLEIVYEDPDVVAVNKPPGLLTDTASIEQHREQDSVYKRLRAWLRPSGDRPFTVHRIDRDTSGLVLFARNPTAERNLRNQFRNRSPVRIYRAIVSGLVQEPVARWVDHTRWHKGRLLLEKVSPNTPGALETLSDVRVVWRLQDRTEIEVRITTGRRNQIRLQAQLRGHPLVGERLYVEMGRGIPAPRQLLHAWQLEVFHPSRPGSLSLEAPLPKDWP
jgi:23S rRNA pseudouridine1911/1915/1917 synthase